ncbi:hypothetical protein [Clostridium sp. HMP27]|uniref:hypothetical protein n=1 Tax=Clostridium sp. HMP27 TaxID=1487921 RepID=UPI00052CB433|nr:hypothetical protein [Clostridium sp. HMP27]KGK87543.1 hypothetical protein DP68_09595 [Clostridium sp. HMP27]
MISFKTMWEDVSGLITREEIDDIEIIEKYKDGFVVRHSEGNCFVNKNDFIDVWCNILYFKEMPKNQIFNGPRESFKYVYAVMKNLPYIKDNAEVIRLVE